MTEMFSGAVDNGGRGELVAPFYTGPVGIRRRGDTIDLAWFGSIGRTSLPAEATLDGRSVTIVSLAKSGVQRTMVIATATIA